MGRHAEGWKLRDPNEKTPFYSVYFTHKGKRVERSTSERDQGPATRAAERIYADVIHGRVTDQVAATSNDRDLGTDVTEWLEYYGAIHSRNAHSLTAARSRAANVVQNFVSYESVTRENVIKWGVERLGQVSRPYHTKERSTLNVFLHWAHAKGYTGEPFIFPALPKKNDGVRVTTQKTSPTTLSPAQIGKLLAAMPLHVFLNAGGESHILRHLGIDLPLVSWARVFDLPVPKLYAWCIRRGRPIAELVEGRKPVVAVGDELARRLWVRPFFTVLWETGLRPITVMRLRAGESYTKGARSLLIEDKDDKMLFGRNVPLTKEARAALDLAYPPSGEGSIFGMHYRKGPLERAKADAGTPSRFTIYDFRHSRLTSFARSTGDLLGTQHMAGHTQASTTAVYLHASEEDAAKMLVSYAAANRLRGNTVGMAKRGRIS